MLCNEHPLSTTTLVVSNWFAAHRMSRPSGGDSVAIPPTSFGGVLYQNQKTSFNLSEETKNRG